MSMVLKGLIRWISLNAGFVVFARHTELYVHHQRILCYCFRFGLPFIVRVLRELSYERLHAAILKAMARILLDNVSSKVRKWARGIRNSSKHYRDCGASFNYK